VAQRVVFFLDAVAAMYVARGAGDVERLRIRALPIVRRHPT
jgi:hypothetical protein